MPHRFDDPLLDQDHAELDGLFAAVGVLAPADLPVCARRIAQAMASHFAREEAAMREADFPALAQHRDMHAALLAAVEEVARVADSLPSTLLNRTLGERIPKLVAHHETIVDDITRRYLDRSA